MYPKEIEKRSFEIISGELGKTTFRDIELPIVKRVIHTTADFDFAKNLRFHPKAVEAGVSAIKNGMDILVDVRMVEAGINKQLLGKWGGKVICNIAKTEHKTQTKTERGIEAALKKNKNIGIIAIGNAPTALFKVLKLLAMYPVSRNPYPVPLVIGVPVGFVRAVESKEELSRMKYPFITALGRKGGSPVAAAIINALLKIAEEKI
ncbi:MAG: precorrin-8X methylmutase [Candidatus Omnitrophota bacterium]|nr:precorrin-8X methylmutase [Candidatus Omnitrophota bacterium]